MNLCEIKIDGGDQMSRYEDLCLAMNKCEDQLQTYRDSARNFSFELAESVRRQIGAPEWWVGPESQKKVPYIQALSVDSQWNNIPEERQHVDMLFDENNFYYFQLSLFLEKKEGAFPKKQYQFRCKLRPQSNGKYILIVAYRDGSEEKKFECEKGGTLSDPINHIYTTLINKLEINPFD